MKSLLLVSGLSLVLAQVMYRCAPNTLQWKNDLGCIQLDPSSTTTNLIYDIRLCSDNVNTYCPASNLPSAQGVETHCTTPPAGKTEVQDAANTFPGDPCTTDTQCLSGTCTGGYCAGKAAGAACEQSSECNPGNYCDVANGCTALVAEGADCDGDEMCPMNMGCNNGFCVLYFSVAEAGTVTDCSNPNDSNYPNFPIGVDATIQYSVFCTSGVCNADGKTCSSALTSTTPLPVKCSQAQGDCPTSNGQGLTGYTTCQNGKNSAGQAYCAAEAGDQPYQDFMTWLKGTYMPLVAQNPEICHTLHRHLEPVCLSMLGGQYLQNQWTVFFNKARNSGEYANSDPCTQQIIEPEIFNPTQSNLFCDTSFSCATNSTTFASDQSCILQGPKTFTIRPCSDFTLSYCPNVHYYHQLNTEVQCYEPAAASAPVAGRYPGDLCGVNAQCLSNICVNGQCAGIEGDGLCKKDADCNPGYYCGTTGKCQALLAVGQTCTSSQQCVMSAGCNFAGGATGTCVAYYSVDTTNLVSDCGMATFLPGGSNILRGNSYMVSYSAFCQSGTCELTGQDENVGNCVNPYQTATPPATCTFMKTDCPSSNGQGGGTSNTPCGCGRSNGARYCALDLGDQPFQDLMQWSKTFIGNTTACHTLRRGLDPMCMQILDLGGMYTTMQFNERFYLATHNQILAETLNCTQQVYLPQYWAAKQYNAYYSSNQNPPEYDFALYGFAASALVLVLS